jgi:hypothetical protein
MTASSRGLGRWARYLALAVLVGLLWPLWSAAPAGAGGGPGRVAGQGTAAQATLETVRPLVEWLAVDQSAWTPVPAGTPATVREGDRMRTGPGAAARLTYFEGSATEIGADTTLVVQRLDRSPGGSIVGNLFQSVGTTVSRVVRLVDAAASFEVETPAATALVRGTQPRVEVATSGITRVANEPDDTGGRVDVEGKDAARTRVTLQPGEETTVVPGQPPSPPRPIGAAASGQTASAAGPSAPDTGGQPSDRPEVVASPSPTFGPAPLEPQPPRLALTPLATLPPLRVTPLPNRLLEGSPLLAPTPFVVPTPIRLPTQPIRPSIPQSQPSLPQTRSGP